MKKTEKVEKVSFKNKLYNNMEEACKDGFDKEFDGGFGGAEGEPFTVWTNKFVYFPTCYDGAEWVSKVRRNPFKDSTTHVGGG